MDKYKKLFSNTLIFALGTFSSKILSFLLLPFISAIIGVSDFGAADLVQQTVNVLVPIVTLAVNSAALRFALDKATNKRSVFTTGITVTFCGFFVFVCLTPLISRIKIEDFALGEYIVLISVFLLVSSMRQLCQQFVRGMGWVRLYAIDGVIATATYLVFTLLYIGAFKWGVNGMILAIVTSDALSVLFLFVVGRLGYFLRFNRLRKSVTSQMLKYCVPLIPTVILWWIINVSDRYMVTYFAGLEANGLYAAASKIPNFVVLFSSIFIDAWQLSAVDEYDNKGRAKFFSNIFRVYSGSIFAVGSCLILFTKLITSILLSDAYYESWKFTPILIMSTVFSCLVNFLASVYMAEKKSVMAFLTASSGAVTNVALNFLLIPKFGGNGAAIATVCSFVIVFIFRSINTRKYVKIKFNTPKIILNTVLLAAQSALLILDPQGKGIWYVAALTVVVVALNVKPILEIAKLLIGKYLKRSKKA